MLLEGRGLGWKYEDGPWLFRDVDIAVKAGEVVGLVGPSGSGKTTLGRILAGYEKPLEGHVDVEGFSESGGRAYHPVQMVFQHPERAVNPRLKLRTTLSESWTPGSDLLQSLGIKPEWLNRYPDELSGGELQRLCIARALNPLTRVIIADEMTTMLDAITQAQIWHAVLDIARKRGLGLIVVSHDHALVERICHRTIDWQAHIIIGRNPILDQPLRSE